MEEIYEMADLLQEVQGILEDCDFKTVTKEQKGILRENYNKGMIFDYCQDGGYIFLMSENDFKTFEYHMGMEYAKEEIEIKMQLNGNVLVAYYDNCERAKEIIDLLEENEEN